MKGDNVITAMYQQMATGILQTPPKSLLNTVRFYTCRTPPFSSPHPTQLNLQSHPLCVLSDVASTVVFNSGRLCQQNIQPVGGKDLAVQSFCIFWAESNGNIVGHALKQSLLQATAGLRKAVNTFQLSTRIFVNKGSA